MSSSVMAPECGSCNEPLSIFTTYVMLHLDGEITLCFAYHCTKWICLNKQILMLKAPISYVVLRSLLRTGIPVIQEDDNG